MTKPKNLAVEFDLSKYSKAKPETRELPWVTSVNLTQRHRQFIEKSNLNFSELVRDFLDSLIGGSK